MANLKLARKLNILAWVVTVIVLILVALMRRVHIPIDMDLSALPMVNALLNTITAMFLVFAFLAIKKKNIQRHRQWIYAAMSTSLLFLLSYVAYHFTSDVTVYCGTGTVKMIYLFILITHIILAALILPFIFFTFIRAYTGQIDRHKRMARWVFPLWLYVAITGPICYIMLAPCYGN